MSEKAKNQGIGISSTARRAISGAYRRWGAITLQFLSLPVTIAVVGWIVTAYTGQLAVSKDYVTLAVHILQDSSQPEAQKGLRDWAVQLLNHYSVVKFNPALQAALQTGATSLPAGTVPDWLSQLERQIIAAERQQRASTLDITLPREFQADLRTLLKRVEETNDPESSAIAKRLLDRLPD